MKGQWVGSFIKSDESSGDYEGQRALMNIDETRDNYSAVLYLFFKEQTGITPLVLLFDVPKNEESKFGFDTKVVFPVSDKTGLVGNRKDVLEVYPNLYIPTEAHISGERLSDGITILIHLKDGSTQPHFFSIKFTLLYGAYNYQLDVRSVDWEGYKQAISSIDWKRPIFRGQNEPWRLRTAFHRNGRYDVARFMWQDVKALHRHLSSRTNHFFNLKDPEESGAFIELVQHHGYPTPFLDWTYSPYVAAFFAFHGITNAEGRKADNENKVRVFAFDLDAWCRYEFQSRGGIQSAHLHVTFAEFPAIDNDRSIPQQSVTLSTNVDDIEAYIAAREEFTQRKYIRAFDIPVRDRSRAMKDLEFMGITPGSMFPGLDGACLDIKARLFFT